MITARPSSLTSPRTRSSRRACTDTSSPPVGSSMNTRRGSVTRLRAICSRCPHAAGIGFRRIIDTVGRYFDPLQPRRRSFANLAVVPPADRHQPLADIGSRRNGHPQTHRRVLMHIAPIGAEQKAPLPLLPASQDRESRRRACDMTPALRLVVTASKACEAASIFRSRTLRQWQAPRLDKAGTTRSCKRAIVRRICSGLRRRGAADHRHASCHLMVGAEAGALMAVGAARFAVISVGTHEHPATLVVNHDFIEI